MTWQIRPMAHSDLDSLMSLQEEGAVAGMSEVFPQDSYPFPREVLRDRWSAELGDPEIAAYVATDEQGRLLGFAARRGDELLHFGTRVDDWGSGLAAWLHDRLLETYLDDVTRVRLRVFEGNRRAHRFYEKLGWTSTGRTSRTTFAPYPVLLEYVRERTPDRPGPRQ